MNVRGVVPGTIGTPGRLAGEIAHRLSRLAPLLAIAQAAAHAAADGAVCHGAGTAAHLGKPIERERPVGAHALGLSRAA